MKQLIIASTSTIYGSKYLEYLFEDLTWFFKQSKKIVFIPYARPSGISYNEYTEIAKNAFSKINKTIIGLHTFKNPKEGINKAEAIFVGGGNTFVLLSQLYKLDLINILKETITNGTPYLGTSAGSNICGLNIKTTNDMPIIYPPNFKALGILPFNINPHYIDSDENSKHMGETRGTRIKEFHYFNTQPVVGLREGSWLKVLDSEITLKGKHSARVFKQNKTPYEIKTGRSLSNLN